MGRRNKLVAFIVMCVDGRLMLLICDGCEMMNEMSGLSHDFQAQISQRGY
jgi:hypothetical protein